MHTNSKQILSAVDLITNESPVSAVGRVADWGSKGPEFESGCRKVFFGPGSSLSKAISSHCFNNTLVAHSVWGKGYLTQRDIVLASRCKGWLSIWRLQ